MTSTGSGKLCWRRLQRICNEPQKVVSCAWLRNGWTVTMSGFAGRDVPAHCAQPSLPRRLIRCQRRRFYPTLFFIIVTLSGTACAFSAAGKAWIVRRDQGGLSTGEYFLVIDTVGIEISMVKISGFKLARTTVGRDFYNLTHQPANEGIWYRQINPRRSRIWKSLRKKAWAASNALIKQGRLDRKHRQAWMDAWVGDKLTDRRYAIDFEIRKQRYERQIGFTSFEEPVNPTGRIDKKDK